MSTWKEYTCYIKTPKGGAPNILLALLIVLQLSLFLRCRQLTDPIVNIASLSEMFWRPDV